MISNPEDAFRGDPDCLVSYSSSFPIASGVEELPKTNMDQLVILMKLKDGIGNQKERKFSGIITNMLESEIRHSDNFFRFEGIKSQT